MDGLVKLQTKTIERLRDALLQSGRRPSLVASSAYETLTREGLLSPEEVTALNRVEPLAETMFLMMAADGKLTADEYDAVRGGVRGLTDNVLRSGTINVMLENYVRRLGAEARGAPAPIARRLREAGRPKVFRPRRRRRARRRRRVRRDTALINHSPSGSTSRPSASAILYQLEEEPAQRNRQGLAFAGSVRGRMGKQPLELASPTLALLPTAADISIRCWRARAEAGSFAASGFGTWPSSE